MAPDLDDFTWRKSSYSAANGDCVEVGWRKSSYSAPNGNCVEVSRVPAEVRVRDTKSRDTGTLSFAAAHWRTFLRTIAR